MVRLRTRYHLHPSFYEYLLVLLNILCHVRCTTSWLFPDLYLTPVQYVYDISHPAQVYEIF